MAGRWTRLSPAEGGRASSPPLSRHMTDGGAARVHPPGLPSEERKILSCHGARGSPPQSPPPSQPQTQLTTHLRLRKRPTHAGDAREVAPLALNKSVLLSLRVIVVIGLVVGLSCGKWVKPRSRVFEG